MKDKTFLRPYDQSKDLADSISKLLENETWEDQERQASLNTLKTLIEKKYLVMDSIISGFDRNQLEMTDPLRLKSFFSKELMDHIRSTAGDIQFAEQARLQQRSDEMTTRFYTLYAINQLLDKTLELAMDRVHLNDITIIRSYSSDICDVSVDAERMQIAFLNIIVNAIEAMEPGKGVLQIKTFAKEDKCVVAITDNGLGMDKESLSRIFEPYFTNKPKGTSFTITLDFA